MMKQLTKTPARWFLFSSAVLCAATAGALYAGLRLNLTPSLPVGVYQTTHGQVEPGAIVVACLPEPAARLAAERGYVGSGHACADGTEPIGKLVLAAGGDTVEVRNRGLSVNGRAIPRTGRLPRDSDGRPVPLVAEGIHVVQAGELWLVATIHRRSFDSRYFGPVPSRNVLSVVRPVWLWWGADAAADPFRPEWERPTFARRRGGE
jgi:conjugative transfer signal peptidase TraF